MSTRRSRVARPRSAFLLTPRCEVQTRSGPASCVDTDGGGCTALFVHGVGTSSFLWRHVFAQLEGERRCVAVDLPLHGRTPATVGQDFSLSALAEFVGDLCDAVGLADVDLVANDTGRAVAQILAARQTGRLRTLTLTNCEMHGHVPPSAFLPTVLLARAGLLARSGPRLLRDLSRASTRVYGRL